MRLTKAELRERPEALRKLTLDADLAGLISSEDQSDEYDCLVRPLLTLLERSASEREITMFLESELKDHFGVEDTSHARAFAQAVKSSYDEKWPRAAALKDTSE